MKYYTKEQIEKEDVMYIYPLTPKSLVWDVGGYNGDFARKINNIYQCFVEVFEPREDYYFTMKNSLISNPNDFHKIAVWPWGLSASDRVTFLKYDGDNPYTKFQDSNVMSLSFAGVKTVINESSVDVDLMRIDIEGEEYGLLETMIEEGLLKRVKYLQVRFYSLMDIAMKKKYQIEQGLNKTHRLLWSGDNVWKSWERIA